MRNIVTISEKLKSSYYETVYVDADDTLWQDAIYFSEIVSGVLSLISNKDMTKNELYKMIDTNLQSCGESGFINALLKVACKFEISDKNELTELCNNFLRHPIELLPFVELTLELINSQLVIVSKGIYSEQNRKIDNSGLRHFFSDCIILPKKDSSEWSKVFGDKDTSKLLVIGNSLKHDIVPTYNLGCSVIWLNHENNARGANMDSHYNTIVEIRSWEELYDLLR